METVIKASELEEIGMNTLQLISLCFKKPSDAFSFMNEASMFLGFLVVRLTHADGEKHFEEGLEYLCKEFGGSYDMVRKELHRHENN